MELKSPNHKNTFWTKEWQERIKASEEDLAKGDYKTFKTKRGRIGTFRLFKRWGEIEYPFFMCK
ncbi:hypothetical protein GCM10020331_034380 [Ectobacillus funiculus]